MKLKLLGLSFLFAVAPFAALADAPIQPEVATKFQNIETETGSRTGYLRQFRAVYDTSRSGFGSIAAHGLGVYLPAKSTILRGWATISSRFDAGGTIALSCEDAGNLLAATDLSIANYTNGTLIRLIPQDTLATVVKGTTIAAQCEITATVASSVQGNGKMVIWGEYFVSE